MTADARIRALLVVGPEVLVHACRACGEPWTRAVWYLGPRAQTAPRASLTLGGLHIGLPDPDLLCDRCVRWARQILVPSEAS